MTTIIRKLFERTHRRWADYDSAVRAPRRSGPTVRPGRADPGGPPRSGVCCRPTRNRRMRRVDPVGRRTTTAFLPDHTAAHRITLPHIPILAAC